MTDDEAAALERVRGTIIDQFYTLQYVFGDIKIKLSQLDKRVNELRSDILKTDDHILELEERLNRLVR